MAVGGGGAGMVDGAWGATTAAAVVEDRPWMREEEGRRRDRLAAERICCLKDIAMEFFSLS
jgi:predicted transposase YbfD/YdcC